MRLLLLFLGITLSTAHSETPLARSLSCSNVTIRVPINTANFYISPSVNSTESLNSTMQNVFSGLLNLVSNVTVSGSYNIAARFCEPEVKIPSRANTIQLLVHGITYSKDYWSGLGAPGKSFNGDTYSWIAYASKQGYYTLSIDRLGNGESDRPDGLTVVQMGSHIEVTESIVNKLKSGNIGGRVFNKIIYVGHWYGSLIGNLHAVKYPFSVDSYVLTGFTKKIRPSLIPTLITGAFLPAALAYPERWGDQSLTYFASASKEGGNKLFFVESTSDPELRALNFALRGTVTAGEFISAYASTQVASVYRGRVFVLTGQNDAIFCSPGELGQGTLTGKGDCGAGPLNLVAQTRELYPLAAVYEYSTPDTTGHCNTLHTNSQAQFDTVHKWLGRFY